MTELPRLGFLGVGWIGRARMLAVQKAGAAQVATVADVDPAAARQAALAAGDAPVAGDLDELLEHELDGVVIATPTALHASQVSAVLARGLPVFCQKPLGRSAAECRELVTLARRADRRLGVDMSYRHLEAVTQALARLHADEVGPLHAAELVFHNAYGPDKEWVRDVRLAGGGALIDLGCHLLDLARLFLGDLDADAVHADLFAGGRRLAPDPAEVEDLALAQVTLSGGRVLRLACSWWLPAGADAVISLSFFGARGALRISNVAGSFYDFQAELVRGRQGWPIAAPPDAWGGRALALWASQLSRQPGYDPEVEALVAVAELIDHIYGRPA